MHTVSTATPYQHRELGSFGKASNMLLRQFQFPFRTYEENERLLSAESDRCFMWDYDNTRRCFTQHTGTGELGLESWVTKATTEQVMAFLKDILKVGQQDVVWTGFRVCGTVNRSNGYPVWSFSLFAKDPRSKTIVYSSPIVPKERQVCTHNY